ncbi:MAG: hypothetical protein ACJ8AF_06255 [Gemmatimonadaceae bacterium]
MNIMQQDRGGADVVIAPQGKAPSVTVYTDGRNLQIPTTRDQMLALTARRDQLNEQLESVTDRRSDIIEQMRTAPNPAMQGLQAQLAALDSRVLQLEGDLATTGQEIAAASPELISIMGDSPREDTNGSFDDGVGAGVAGTFVTMSLLFFLGFRWWKKSARRRAPQLASADSERLQRLEQGMDAVAVEIERISEGQRFVTKLLSESRSAQPTPR